MLMIPEFYYEIFLKGKNSDQIMDAICEVKQEIDQIKNKIETPNYKSTEWPSEGRSLWGLRQYLECAKQAFADAGGVYVPSEVEQKAALFDASISSIRKIVFCIEGYDDRYETRIVTIDGDYIYFDDGQSVVFKPSKITKDLRYMNDKKNLFYWIRELHLGEWKENYINSDILGGTQWKLIVEFSDGCVPFEVSGSNAYPYNFNVLLSILEVDRGIIGNVNF